MATNYNYPSADTIESQAQYRPGVPTRLLNVLTGGLAGAITGSTEKAQEAARARQMILQEDAEKRNEQRMLERMKLQRQLSLEDSLKLAAAQDELTTRRQKEAIVAAREAKRPELMGKLKALPDYQAGGAMAMPIPALEPIETLEESVSMEEARQKQEEEARKLKSGYINLGAIGGTPEQIRTIAEKYPEYKNLIEQAIRRAGAEEPKVVSRQDPLTGKRIETIEFPKTYTPQMRKDYIESLGETESNIFGNEPAPGVGSNQPQATKPTSFPGYRVTIPGKEELK
jgi:hypothetical protein